MSCTTLQFGPGDASPELAVKTQQIEQLVSDHLSEQCIDIYCAVNEILRLADEWGYLACDLGRTEEGLVFSTREQVVCEKRVIRAKTLLRVMCGRLVSMCDEQGKDVRVYGDTTELLALNAAMEKITLKLAFVNTSSEQRFTLETAA